ncbi:MAG: CpaF family protein [Actinobacteria bacterium]|nr:CpaF family protein [Actinomycetota bacterium]
MNSTGLEEMEDYLGKKVMVKIKELLPRSYDLKDRKELIRKYIEDLVEEEKIIIGRDKLDHIKSSICEDSLGFGPISILVEDKSITEIMINDYNLVYIEQDGVIKKTGIAFRDRMHLKNMVDKILSPLGLRIDESSPMVDARLEDGSRLNAVMHPVSYNGMVVTIRKFNENMKSAVDLVSHGTFTQEILDFIKTCIEKKVNILVSGGTSTGKTTLLNIISNFIPSVERVITIEETLELDLKLPHVVRMEGKPPNIEGAKGISLRDLTRNALRMRPDRIIIGEIRGGEALDVLQAMNTGHDGSLCTIHANSPGDAITRLETILLMHSANLDPSTARRIIAASVDLIIQLARRKNGMRVVEKISEVSAGEKNIGRNMFIDIKDIFRLEENCRNLDAGRDGINKNRITGTGYLPDFIKD